MTTGMTMFIFYSVLSAVLLFVAVRTPRDKWWLQAGACAGFVIAGVKATAFQVLVLLGG